MFLAKMFGVLSQYFFFFIYKSLTIYFMFSVCTGVCHYIDTISYHYIGVCCITVQKGCYINSVTNRNSIKLKCTL